MPELFVTNFNRNFTGVSATAANVIRQQARQFDLRLVGHPLPGCPEPISLREARALSRQTPAGRTRAIWHVRRNTEMRAALWARDVLKLPIRIVFTSAAQRRHSAFPRWLISRMDAVIATTEAAATYVPHVRAVVPHGVDTELFTPAQNRAQAWQALGYEGGFGIATVGRIRPEKGTDRFVETMLRLLPEMPGATALVIGRAAPEHQGFLRKLDARIKAAGLADRFVFTGEVPPQALPDLMRGLSLLVQLPRYEGYGMTPLEGMASGVPFVATDTGYYRSFSAQGQTGTIVGDEDIEAVLAAQDLLSPTRHSAAAGAARDIAQTRFSIQTEADGIAKTYEELW